MHRTIAAAAALLALLALTPAALAAPADPRFAFDHVRTSLVGTHVRGREVRGGVPVDGTYAVVHLLHGAPARVRTSASPLPGSPVPVAVPQQVATAAALQALGAGSGAHVAAERLLVPVGAALVDTWRVGVVSTAPAVAAVVDVDAATGQVRAVADARRFEDATAQLFDPNPIVSARDASLRQAGVDEAGADTDLSTAAIDAQLRPLPLLGYDPARAAAGHLVGPWVTAIGPAPFVAVGDELMLAGKSDPRFEAAMTYAHLDRVQRYFQDTLGLTDVNAESQEVVALPVQGFDNSFYQPANDLMLLGAGGVDDGEDAEVTLHEYGHAIHDDQVPGWGDTHEGGSMGEGFGDFLAAAFYARDISGGFQDPCLMDWDSTSYSSTDPACIRRTDTGKHYPEDLEDEVHADGELWSQYLWDVRARLGTTSQEQTDNALTLVLTSHSLLDPDAEFADAVDALIDAAGLLGHPDWAQVSREEALDRGFPVD